jgi:hypothetical protein
MVLPYRDRMCGVPHHLVDQAGRVGRRTQAPGGGGDRVGDAAKRGSSVASAPNERAAGRFDADTGDEQVQAVLELFVGAGDKQFFAGRRAGQFPERPTHLAPARVTLARAHRHPER